MSFILSIQVHIQNKYQISNIKIISYIYYLMSIILLYPIYIEKIYNINMLTQTGPEIKPRTPNI